MRARSLHPSSAEQSKVNSTKPDQPFISLPQLRLDADRQAMLDYFENGWALTELLFSGLADDAAYYRRPFHQLRHPMIFYYAHPVVLYINKLRIAGLLEAPLDPTFEQLFETGVDEMRWDDLHEGEQHIWPSVEIVRTYRERAYRLIRNLIATHPLLEPEHLPITQKSPLWALVMAFEHERIHLETSSVLMRELPIECVRKPARWPDSLAGHATDIPIANRMIAQPAGEVTLGKPPTDPSFGWDNEYGQEVRHVRPFAASAQLISNAEFHAFVKAGGYSIEKYWSREGWAWRGFRNVRAPAFWVAQGPAGLHDYRLRTIFEIIDMRWSWPVGVNFYEANAYAAWRSEQDHVTVPYRLPTEAQHHAMREDAQSNLVMQGDCLAQGYNANFATGSESPVDALPANRKGYHDVFGNVWQWCEDHFHPLSGSKPHPYYADFSIPCYDGEHQMILGGSFISTGDEAGIWARFHFRPHFFQHAGFRLAQSADGNPASDAKLWQVAGSSTYETQEMIERYLLMHWGSEEQIWGHVPASVLPRPQVVSLPVKCAELVKRFTRTSGRALDLGCAVGRASFELARDFAEVVGIDYSHEFVGRAQSLQQNGALNYWRKDSGGKGELLSAVVDPAIDRTRLAFAQGDACALPSTLGAFDAVLLANVLCRLPDPAACLDRLQGPFALVNRGGIVMMTTPFSWLEAYTPRARWLDGIAGVQAILTEFELLHQEELPFLIRDHARRFEYIVTQASVWRRK